MWQVWRFLVALLGAVRSAIGRGLVRRRLGQLADLPAPERFSACWKYAMRLRRFFSGRADHANRFRIGWLNHAMFWLVRRVHGTDVPPFDLLEIRGLEPAPDPMPAGNSALVFSVHSRLEDAIPQALISMGYRSSLITGLDLEGGQSAPEGKRVAPMSLLLFRKLAQEGIVAVSLGDFTCRRAGTLFHDHYLSTALLTFAQRCGIPLIFAYASPLPSGRIRVDFRPVGPKADTADVDDLAEEFRRFVRGCSDVPADWKVVRSPSEAPATGRQLKDLCLTR